MWPGIDQTKRADGQTSGRPQGRTRVEARAGAVAHVGMIGKTGVAVRVRDDHDLVFEDRVGAERDVAGRFPDGRGERGLEPLAVVVQEGERGPGRLANRGGEGNEIVVRLLGRGVENMVAAQGGDALVVVIRDRGRHGAGRR